MAFVAGQKVRASELNALSNGLVASTYVTTNSASGITTTETVLDYVTANLTSGRTYEVWWEGDMVGSTANSTYAFRCRYLAAASLVVTGSTLVHGKTWEIKAFGGHEPQFMTGRFTAPSTAQFSVGIAVVRLLGTGSVQALGASGNERYLSLTDVTKP